MPRFKNKDLTIEQCEVLKALGLPQATSEWYIRQIPDGDVRIWAMPYPWEGYNPDEDEEPLVCEQIVACAHWADIEDWLGTSINLRYLGEEIGLWETHIENGPTATAKSRDEAAYNLVLRVKQASSE